MSKRVWVIFLIAFIILPMAVIGCKGKVEKPQEASTTAENPEAMQLPQQPSQETAVVTEPAQSVATETIPPTAAPEIAPKTTAMQPADATRSKDIQRALKNAGFYAGSVDGKIGPKTKKSIEEFQKAKGLKADGKVGPKTWSELQQYLTQ